MKSCLWLKKEAFKQQLICNYGGKTTGTRGANFFQHASKWQTTLGTKITKQDTQEHCIINGRKDNWHPLNTPYLKKNRIRLHRDGLIVVLKWNVWLRTILNCRIYLRS